MTDRPQEFAYFYPEPYWRGGDSDWVKNLLLFFDGVSVLLPQYMHNPAVLEDRHIGGAMIDRGLLRVLRPEEVVNYGVTEALGNVLIELLANGALDHLSSDGSNFSSLSRSRLGFSMGHEIAHVLLEELKERNLAADSEDGFSIPMNPEVRLLILTLLSQIICTQFRAEGLRFAPTTPRPELASALLDILSTPTLPSSGHVIVIDLEVVSFDLTAVPLDDVLEFRATHGEEFRAYRRDLNRFLRELSGSPVDERRMMLEDRREELADRASDLRRRGRSRWIRPMGKASLGIAGAWWNLSQNDPIGAATAFGSALLEAPESNDVGSFSYLFSIERAFINR
jgi:hypothetical protein